VYGLFYDLDVGRAHLNGRRDFQFRLKIQLIVNAIVIVLDTVDMWRSVDERLLLLLPMTPPSSMSELLAMSGLGLGPIFFAIISSCFDGFVNDGDVM